MDSRNFEKDKAMVKYLVASSVGEENSGCVLGCLEPLLVCAIRGYLDDEFRILRMELHETLQ